MTPPAIQPASVELLCSDVHFVDCAVRLSSCRPDDLVRLAREHGAQAHGFTSAWYTEARQDLITGRFKGH